MKNKILIYGRFLTAIIILILSVLAFYRHFYPVKIFDIQLTAALQSGLISGFSISVILLGAVIIMTLLFGRIYCSTLCPLGIYQELLTILFKPFYKKRQPKIQKHYVFSYFIAAILFGLLFSGTIVLLRFIDPYAVAGNALSGTIFGLGFITALTVLVFFKKRFFCSTICPIGTVLGFISRFSVFKVRIDVSKCKMCTLCAKSCPCGSIDFKNHTVDNETCVKCFKCLSFCKHNALYYGFPKTKDVHKFNINRRKFLTSALVIAVFGSAFRGGMKLSKTIASKIKNVILPAGSNNISDFANRCLNCNLCVQNCPQKIIKPATKDIPFVHLDYGHSYCKFNCRQCSAACPSGAIERISLKQKQNIKIANAVIDEDICVQCGVCAYECPKQIIIKKPGKLPIIQFDKCIGCGKCATICPVKAIKLEPVSKQINLITGE